MMARPKALVDYQNWVVAQSKNALAAAESEDDSATIDPLDFLTDVIMKRLRTLDGLDLGWVKDHYGQTIVDAVLRGASLGLDMKLMNLVEGEDPDTKQLCLTDPEGFLYSNNLISNIFLELEDFDDDSQDPA